MGFFLVTDVPERRVVQYRRVSESGESVVYLADESILGKAVGSMPFADKTGIAAQSAGVLFEVPYLADMGDVYISVQPADAAAGATLKIEAKAGTKPYKYQWYKNSMQVVNVPDTGGSLVAGDAGKYFCVVTDATGKEVVSVAAEVK